MYKKIIIPAAILAGTIIGAGIFALPYAVEKAGFLTGLFYLAIFTFIISLFHLMYADIVLRTEGDHRLAGYAEIYLGQGAKWLALFTSVIGLLLILTAYLILSASFLNILIPALPPSYRIFIFWLISSLPVFGGIKKLGALEFFTTYGLLLVISAIFFYGLSGLGKITGLPIMNPTYFFLPYGAVLLALSGRAGITAVIDYLQKIGEAGPELARKTKRAVILGTLFSALLSSIFVLAILTLSPQPSADSISGLGGRLPFVIVALLGFLGLISIWDTYIVIGYDVRRSLRFDFRLPDFWATTAVLFSPLVLYLARLQNFLKVIGLAGGIFIGLEGVFVALMWRRLSKLGRQKAIFEKPHPIIVPALLFIFVLGIIMTLVNKSF